MRGDLKEAIRDYLWQVSTSCHSFPPSQPIILAIHPVRTFKSLHHPFHAGDIMTQKITLASPQEMSTDTTHDLKSSSLITQGRDARSLDDSTVKEQPPYMLRRNFIKPSLQLHIPTGIPRSLVPRLLTLLFWALPPNKRLHPLHLPQFPLPNHNP